MERVRVRGGRQGERERVRHIVPVLLASLPCHLPSLPIKIRRQGLDSYDQTNGQSAML